MHVCVSPVVVVALPVSATLPTNAAVIRWKGMLKKGSGKGAKIPLAKDDGVVKEKLQRQLQEATTRKVRSIQHYRPGTVQSRLCDTSNRVNIQNSHPRDEQWLLLKHLCVAHAERSV